MEAALRYWPAFVVIVIVAGGLGFLIGRMRKTKHYDGMIFVEPMEDSDRERIRFVLELELDEIKQRKSLSFCVNDRSSKNSQPI